MSNPFTELANEIKKLVNERRHVFATVSGVSTAGISLRIDGGTDGTAKEYTCNTAVRFAVGDRVLVCRESGTYTVICKVGKPGGPTAKTSDMTQPVGVDADGKLYTKPASAYTLPTASSATLGGVKPTAKTAAMTQPVGVDSSGALWTAPPASANVSRIYGDRTTAYYIDLTSGGVFRPASTGYDIGSTAYPFRTLYVGASSTYYWKIDADGIVPNAKSTSYFDIGSSTYPVSNLYAQAIYLNGTKLTLGTSMAGSSVTMGGSTSYYIVCNTSRELRPYSTSTTYPCYLGTSSYYWHYAYLGSNTVSLGNSKSSKLGFFGTTPVVRQTVSSTATVATLITALKAYGLIG
ncbi:MAG: hypothetical protein II333_02365 [Clostridia bacterium]|nr:hypothetical protein [Clostridia bacterium]